MTKISSHIDKILNSVIYYILSRLFEHPLLQDSKIGERKTWWNSYIKGDAFQPTKTCWPVQRLKERRSEQEEMNTIKAMEAIAGVEHTEEEMPLHRKEYLVKWKPSWVPSEDVTCNNCLQDWSNSKRKR
ncbi:uncharacterized protein LOC144663103 [Oculina patagonica]